MLCVRKLTPGTEISWARDAQPERVQKCVAEGEAESTPCQLEATAPCSVASTKAGVHPVASHVMELPLCGEPLWLFMAPGWKHESGHGGPIHPSHLQRTFPGGLVVGIWLSHMQWALVCIRLCVRHCGVPGAPNTSPPSRTTCPARKWDQAMPTWYSEKGRVLLAP